jgi:hypothetical protein
VRRSFDVRTLDPEAPYERDRSYIGATDLDLDASIEVERVMMEARGQTLRQWDREEARHARQIEEGRTSIFDLDFDDPMTAASEVERDWDLDFDYYEEEARIAGEHAEVCAEEVERHGFCRHCEEREV